MAIIIIGSRRYTVYSIHSLQIAQNGLRDYMEQDCYLQGRFLFLLMNVSWFHPQRTLVPEYWWDRLLNTDSTHGLSYKTQCHTLHKFYGEGGLKLLFSVS